MKNLNISDINAQYIINDKGKRTAVVLDIKTFENIIEELEDICLGKMASEVLLKEKEFVSYKDVKKKLKK